MTQDILVVGAGPVGLTMAVQLARFGVPCRIVDINPGVTDKSKALVVHSRTMEIFEDMGIIEPALNQGLHCGSANIYANGHQIIRLNLNELNTPYPFFLDLNQSDTETILYDRLKNLGVDVQWQTQITQLTQTDDAVKVTLQNANGQTEAISAKYLCACDGSHSFCRHALNLDFPGEAYPHTFLLADVELDWSQSRDEWYAYLTEKGLIFAAPIKNNRWRIITESPEHTSRDKVAPTLEDVQAVVKEKMPDNIVVSNPVWLSYFRAHHRILNRFGEGRVFFAGDAAHIHSPVGGQGMNTGIQDAYNLAWKLALVLSGAARPELLDSYNTERHSIAKNLLMGTDKIFRTVLLREPISRGIRDRLAGFLGSLEIVQHRLEERIAMLSIGYRESPIVGDNISGLLVGWHDFGSKLKAGDRAVDASAIRYPQETSERLFNIINGLSHHLLLFVGKHPKPTTYQLFQKIVEVIGKGYSSYIVPHIVLLSAEEYSKLQPLNCSLLVDSDGKCHHRYAASSECFYMIRPDGYIGWRAQPADLESLLHYCNKIFVNLPQESDINYNDHK